MPENEEQFEEELPEVTEEEFYCFGCGVKLQSDNPKQKGYIPNSAKATNAPLLCQRCFRIQHYAEEQNNEEFNENDFIKILQKAKSENAIVVYVVDLFSFESTFIDKINSLLTDMDVIFVANKRDILPKAVNDQKLADFVLKRAVDMGINAIDIVVTSASKNYNIDELISKIMSLRHGGNVYVVGSASCGKSSLINTLLKNYSNETNNFITVSPYPGTTIDVIEVPIDDNSYIYDTPGLTIKNSIITLVDRKVLNQVTPKSEIKPLTYQLEQEQSLIIGGLAYFDFVSGPKSNFTVYVSNMVQVNRSKLKRAPEVFESLIKNKQVRPITSLIKGNDDLETHQFVLGNKGKYDIGINGLGWISVEGKGQKIVVHAPKDISVYVIDAKI